MEALQAKLFKLNLKGHKLNQLQSLGASFINELKNILISYFAAKLVIEGTITLGTMLAVQYIIGQLNVPIIQLIDLIKNGQNASLSLKESLIFRR
jgi:ATP-binding cassette subfamily B protein